MIHMCLRLPKLRYSLNDKENKEKCELIEFCVWKENKGPKYLWKIIENWDFITGYLKN